MAQAISYEVFPPIQAIPTLRASQPRPSRYATLSSMYTGHPTPSPISLTDASIIDNHTSAQPSTTLYANQEPIFHLPVTSYKFDPGTFLRITLHDLHVLQNYIYSAAVRYHHMNEKLPISAPFDNARCLYRRACRMVWAEAAKASDALDAYRETEKTDRDGRSVWCRRFGGLRHRVRKMMLAVKIKKTEVMLEDLWNDIVGAKVLWEGADEAAYHWG